MSVSFLVPGSKLLAPTSGLPNDDTEELERELEALNGKMGQYDVTFLLSKVVI